MVVYRCTWSVKYARRAYRAPSVPSSIRNGAMSKHKANLIILIHLVDFTDDWTKVEILLFLQSKETNWFKSPALNRNIDLTEQVLGLRQTVETPNKFVNRYIGWALASPSEWRKYASCRSWEVTPSFQMKASFIRFYLIRKLTLRYQSQQNSACGTRHMPAIFGNFFFSCSRVADPLFWSRK